MILVAAVVDIVAAFEWVAAGMVVGVGWMDGYLNWCSAKIGL